MVNVSTEGEPLFIVQPAHGRLIVNGSTAKRITPTGLHMLAVLDDARHRWVATGKREHLCASRLIVLRVVFEKRNAFRVVMVARLLAIRTPWFYVDY